MAPIVRTGSIALEEVLPTLAQTKAGVSPAALSAAICAARASGRMAKCSSTAMVRRFSRPRPATIMAFSMEECACEEA
jgi:hypothetical protein